MEKEKIKEKEQQILALAKEFCTNVLKEDNYSMLAEKLILKMGRKRNVPFETGKVEIWACAVIHALGTINFLFDKSNKPYTTVDELNKYFGTKKSTTGNKSKEIREMFKMNYFDSEFSTNGIKEINPFNNFVMVDGFIVSIDSLPEEYQKMVKEARAKGEDISFYTK